MKAHKSNAFVLVFAQNADRLNLPRRLQGVEKTLNRVASRVCEMSSLLRILTAAVVVAVVRSQAPECLSARDVGNSACGNAGGQRFFFHAPSKTCQPFRYQGCDGNENRFASKQDCMTKCSSTSSTSSPAQKSSTVCSSGAYAAGATSGSSAPCSSCPTGYSCENDVCCPTKGFTCDLDYDAGKFGNNGKHTPRYYYSKQFNNCLLFTFYGTDGNANNFATFNECKKFCS